MEMSKLFNGGSKPFSPSRVSFETMRPHVIYRRYTGIYGWYTGGIHAVYRLVYGRYTGGYTVDIRGIYRDIRGYTQYIVSIAYIGYTGIYGDIR